MGYTTSFYFGVFISHPILLRCAGFSEQTLYNYRQPILWLHDICLEVHGTVMHLFLGQGFLPTLTTFFLHTWYSSWRYLLKALVLTRCWVGIRASQLTDNDRMRYVLPHSHGSYLLEKINVEPLFLEPSWQEPHVSLLLGHTHPQGCAHHVTS